MPHVAAPLYQSRVLHVLPLPLPLASLLLLLGVFGVIKWNKIRDQTPVGKVAESQKGSQAKGPSRGYARWGGTYID